MSHIQDEIAQKLNTKEGRRAILQEINTLTFLGPVGETTRELRQQGDNEIANKVVTLENGAIYLQVIANLAIRKIDQIES